MSLQQKRKTVAESSQQVDNISVHEAEIEYNEFVRHRFDHAWVLKKFTELFGAPPAGKGFTLQQMKLWYYLWARTIPADFPVRSDKTHRQYDAAMAMDINGFDEDMQGMIRINQTEEDRMTKTQEVKAAVGKKNLANVKKAGGKTLGLGVWATWIHCFTKTKMTDVEISKFMKSEFPQKKSKVFDMVNFARNVYNKGGLTSGVVPTRLAKQIGGVAPAPVAKAKAKPALVAAPAPAPEAKPVSKKPKVVVK